MTDHQIAAEWTSFFFNEVTHDAFSDGRKTVQTSLLLRAGHFANVMVKLKSGSDQPVPAGSECRQWVRAYGAWAGFPQYAKELQPHREVAKHYLNPVKQAVADIAKGA